MKYLFLNIGLLAAGSGAYLLTLEDSDKFALFSTLQIVFGAVFIYQGIRLIRGKKMN